MHSISPISIPAQCGLGLRPAHYLDILATKPAIDFFELLTEDFIELRGKDFLSMEKIRAHYPVSLHGVSLSIGSCDPLNKKYLCALKKLMHHVDPLFISDHFCWTGVNKINTHDLLPLPYTPEAVDHLVARIQCVQEFLGRQMMFENVSSYAAFVDSEMSEWEFMSEIARRADCFILLDINNVYVNVFNHGLNAHDFLHGIPLDRVKQFHVSGHQHCKTHIIDTHDDGVVDAVWKLYGEAVKRFGNMPLVIERDANIPALSELMRELHLAKHINSITS